MSRASFMKDTDFEYMLSTAENWIPGIIEEALRAGAALMAAEMKKNLRRAIADKEAHALIDSFGITPVGQDRNRNWNVHIGFDGYQMPGTGEWKTTGIPFQMIISMPPVLVQVQSPSCPKHNLQFLFHPVRAGY